MINFFYREQRGRFLSSLALVKFPIFKIGEPKNKKPMQNHYLLLTSKRAKGANHCWNLLRYLTEGSVFELYDLNEQKAIKKYIPLLIFIS
jgi:hypothetical protein